MATLSGIKYYVNRLISSIRLGQQRHGDIGRRYSITKTGKFWKIGGKKSQTIKYFSEAMLKL